MKLLVILASTRPGRLGPVVAEWTLQKATESSCFDDVEFVDLAELNLPFLDEEELPRFGRYEHEHTKRWSDIVDAADAFCMVTAEYNLTPPPPLLNAIDFLAREWRWKANCVVCYGGPSGGVRGTQVLRQALGALNCFTVHECVGLGTITERLNSQGRLAEDPLAEAAAGVMFREVRRLAEGMRTIRQSVQDEA